MYENQSLSSLRLSEICSVKCTEESLNHTFATVAQYGDVAAKLNLITYKNCKIELPELLLIAAFVFQQLI